MEKTSVRLPQELSKKLQAEARKRSEESGKNVTVSDLIRGCIVDNFHPKMARAGEESAALVEVREEVLLLKDHQAQLTREIQKLIGRLSESFPQLATREQVDSLTDGIAALFRSGKGR